MSTLSKREPLARISLASSLTSRGLIQSELTSLKPRPLLSVTHDLLNVGKTYQDQCRLPKGDTRLYIPSATAPPPEIFASDRAFAYKQDDTRFNPDILDPLFGLSGPARESETEIAQLEHRLPGLPSEGIMKQLAPVDVPLAPMRVPQLHKLILDSGKLAALDKLLVELKANGHRVLVYFQMTRMIDLMEEFLSFRQYK